MNVSDLRATYQRIAPFYDLLDIAFERRRYAGVRPQVFDAVREAGSLLDCGIGTGRNVPYYPPAAQITGIDLSPRMLERAGRRAQRHGRAVKLLEANVLDLPFPDDQFDCATATFLFCVLPDELQPPALQEMARVVRPGGRIVILEYQTSSKATRRLSARLWSPWVRFAYGAAFDRRTEDHVNSVGLPIVDRQFVYADTILRLVLEVPAAGPGQP